MASTPDGDTVFVGFLQGAGGVPEAWAVRVAPDGSVLWVTQIEVGADNRTTASGVAITPDGRLYVSGHADDVLDEGWISRADAWVAELAL